MKVYNIWEPLIDYDEMALIRGAIPDDIECVSLEHQLIPIATPQYLNPNKLSFSPLRYKTEETPEQLIDTLPACPSTPIIITDENGSDCIDRREEMD